MKKNILFFIIYISFAIHHSYGEDILEELEFYSAKKIKHDLKEKSESIIKEDLSISESQMEELLDNRQKLTSEKNDLKILDQSVKINYSDDLTFVQDSKEKNKSDGKATQNNNDIKEIEVESASSPVLRIVTKIIRPFFEARIDHFLARMGVVTKLKETLDISSKLKIHIIKDGAKDSKSAVCGNSIEIGLVAEDEYGGVINTDHDGQKFWLTPGRNNFTRGLELGLIGAKIGEEREIIAPFDMNIGSSPFAIQISKATKKATFKVKVHDILEDEELDNTLKSLRYYDGATSLSRQLSCGDFVKTDLRLLNAKGEILYEKSKDQMLFLVLGSNMSRYLEQILLGVRSGGTRIALSNTENLESLKRIPALEGIAKVLTEYSGVVIELSPTFALQ